MLTVLILSGSIKAENDPAFGALCAAGGAAVVAVGWGCYNLFSKREMSPERVVSELQTQAASIKLKYAPVVKEVIINNSDQALKKIAAVLKGNNYKAESYSQNMDKDLNQLRNKISLVQERMGDKKLAPGQKETLKRALQEVMPIIKEFEELSTYLKLNTPFFDLYEYVEEKNDRANRYNRISNGAALFPLVAELEEVEKDARNVASRILAAKMVCNNQQCSDTQDSLIREAEMLRHWLDDEVQRLSRAEKCIKQKEEQKWIEYETAERKREADKQREKTECAIAQVKAEENEKERLRQKDVKQKQNDEQQKIDKKLLKEGRYFNKEREQYKETISNLKRDVTKLKSDCDNVRDQLSNLKDNYTYRLNENNELKKRVSDLETAIALKSSLIEKCDARMKKLEELKTALRQLPINPNHEDAAYWLPWVQKLYDILNSISHQN